MNQVSYSSLPAVNWTLHVNAPLTLLLLLACAGCQAAATPPPPDPLARAGFAPLAPFYRDLAALQAGRSHRVAVLQIGDSHTANDAFSGALRSAMQARFGDAGRGLLPPGVPYRYYRPAQVSVVSDGWQIAPSNGNTPAAGPFGFAGLRQVASDPATLSITADPGGLARLTIEALAQPGGGTLDLASDDGPPISVSTDAPRPQPLRIAAPAGPASTGATVRARGDGPVSLLAWTAERDNPGVTWSNLGTVGATADLVLHWDPATLAAEAAALRPSLVILAFGTNEGFRDSTDLALYATQVRAVLHALRQAAPQAALMVAGPPGGVRAAGPGAPCPGGRDVVPANLPQVRHILHLAAAEAGAFFWNWADAMGGDCAMAEWSERSPPWAAHDHVHLLVPGAQATAAALFDTLMSGYARFPH